MQPAPEYIQVRCNHILQDGECVHCGARATKRVQWSVTGVQYDSAAQLKCKACGECTSTLILGKCEKCCKT